MVMKKLFLLVTVLFFSFQAFAAPVNLFLTVSPSVVLNTLDTKNGAPSPIQCMPGFGLELFNDKKVSFQPSVGWSANYELLAGEKALPAEIENRTAFTQNILLSLPAIYTLELKATKLFGINHRLELGGGPALLLRLSNEARNATGGKFETGTLGGDVEKIKKYHWEKGRFVYLNLQTSWLFSYDTIQVGPSLLVNLPVGSLIASENVNNMIISLAGKLVF